MYKQEVVTSLEKRTSNSLPIILRIWKLGDSSRGIHPTDKTYQLLKDIISQWDGISPLDIVWGDTLTVEQHVVSNSDEIKDVINIIQVAPECTKI